MKQSQTQLIRIRWLSLVAQVARKNKGPSDETFRQTGQFNFTANQLEPRRSSHRATHLRSRTDVVVNEELVPDLVVVVAGHEHRDVSEEVVLVRGAIGWVPGGLALVMVVSCALFGAYSGSIVSAVAAVGSIMIPMMETQGYPRALSAALVSIAGVLAMLIPPSTPFIIYCGVTETPVGPMFLAGILPGILLIIILYLIVLLMSERRIRSQKRYTLKERGEALYEVLPILGIPVVILGGIYGGITSPVEAAAMACAYAAFIGRFVYGELTLNGMIDSLRNSVRITSMIFVLVADTTPLGFVAIMDSRTQGCPASGPTLEA